MSMQNVSNATLWVQKTMGVWNGRFFGPKWPDSGSPCVGPSWQTDQRFRFVIAICLAICTATSSEFRVALHLWGPSWFSELVVLACWWGKSLCSSVVTQQMWPRENKIEYSSKFNQIISSSYIRRYQNTWNKMSWDVRRYQNIIHEIRCHLRS